MSPEDSFEDIVRECRRTLALIERSRKLLAEAERLEQCVERVLIGVPILPHTGRAVRRDTTPQ